MGSREEELNYKIKVMKAYRKGKDIESSYKHDNEGFEYTEFPVWDWDDFDYRIKKKKPIELTIRIDEEGVLTISDTNMEDSKRLRKPLKFIEVTK